MRVRQPINKPKNDPVDAVIPPVKVKRKYKNGKRVKTSHTQSRYASDNLIPLDEFQVHSTANERERWYKSAVTYLRVFIAEGLSREEIRLRLNIDDVTYDVLETRLVERDGAKFTSMGTAHRYYYYMLRMEQCARELDDFIQLHMEEDSRKSGVVGAIKAKAQIFKDTMVMGQELGIVNKRAKELRVLGELNLNVLPTDELKSLYDEKLSEFKSIVQGTKSLPNAYSQILKNATDDANEEADEIIDAEFQEEREASAT